MLERLVGFALSQRLFVALSVLLLIGAGFVVLPSLPIDAFPDVSPVQVKVIMKAPGLTPEEVEQRITVPIELELLGLPNKKILRSSTKYALADITVDFEDGTDIYWARNQVTERLSNIARDLPEGVNGGLAPITSPLGEMFMFTIDSPELSLAERRTLLDWVIRPALRTVPGVADVNALGGYVRAFEIVPLNDALAARGISSELFRRAVEANSRNDGAGRVNQGEDSALVRVEGSIRTIDDIRAIVVDTRDGIPIRVNDVARVQVGSLTRYGAVTIDGRGETVEGLVLGLRGANAGQLVRDVRQRLDGAAALAAEECFYQRLLRSEPAGRPRRRHRRPRAGRSHRPRRRPAAAVPRQLAGVAGDRAQPAARHRHRADRHARRRHVGQSDEPGRACDRNRLADRCAGRRGREHRRQPQQGDERDAAAARPYRISIRVRGAGAGRFGCADHHHRLRSAAHVAGA